MPAAFGKAEVHCAPPDMLETSRKRQGSRATVFPKVVPHEAREEDAADAENIRRRRVARGARLGGASVDSTDPRIERAARRGGRETRQSKVCQLDEGERLPIKRVDGRAPEENICRGTGGGDKGGRGRR